MGVTPVDERGGFDICKKAENRKDAKNGGGSCDNLYDGVYKGAVGGKLIAERAMDG